MHNLKKIYTKKGDISLFTVMVLSMVMMALLFNISIKTNRDLTTSRDSNLSQQAYNKAVKGLDAWIECASDPELIDLNHCINDDTSANRDDLVKNACNEEINNGVRMNCEDQSGNPAISYDSTNIPPSITVKATSRNTSGKIVNRVVKVEFSN